ncbi:Unknown protein, partial [Striga hermonthica]
IRGYGLEHFITGSQRIPEEFISDPTTQERSINPAFLLWMRQDQLLASWLLSSVTESVLVTTVGLTTSKEIWECLESTFASQSHAKILQYRLQLQTIKKEGSSMKDYLNKIKTCCDLLGSAGEKVQDRDHMLYILAGLPQEYNPVLVSLSTKYPPCTVMEAYSVLLSFEARLEGSESQNSANNEQGNFSVNVVTQGQGNRGGFRGRGRGAFQNQRGRGRFGSRSRGRGFDNGKQRCQICHYTNHTAERCYYRADLTFTPRDRSNYNNHSSNQSQGNGPNVNVTQMESDFQSSCDGSNWYPDSGATSHVTYDLANLNSAAEYQGRERVQVGNGTGLNISHFGNSVLKSPSNDLFILKNLLHVPEITKNLIS